MFSKKLRGFFRSALAFLFLMGAFANSSLRADPSRNLDVVAAEILAKQKTCNVSSPPSDCDRVLQELHKEILHKTCLVTARSPGCGAVLLEVLNDYVKSKWMNRDAVLIPSEPKEAGLVADVIYNILDRLKNPSSHANALVGTLIILTNEDIQALGSGSKLDAFAKEWANTVHAAADWYRRTLTAEKLTPEGRKQQNADFVAIGKHIQAVIDATAEPPKPGAKAAAVIKGLPALIAADKPQLEQLASAPIDDLITQLRAFSQKRTGVEIVGAWYGDVLRIRTEMAGHIKAQMPRGTGDRHYPHEVLTLDVNTFSKMHGSIGERYCSAEGPVRVNCQGNPFCYARKLGVQNSQRVETYPNGDPARITPDQLCGFDPVPLSDPTVRGLVILYRCSTLSLIDWERIQIDPRDRDAPGDASPVREIVLRNGVANEIRCALEDDAGAEAKP